MSDTNMICVGGPMHGQRKQVEQGRRWFEVVERPSLEAAYAEPVAMSQEEVAYKRHIYEREIMGAGDQSIEFWRHSEMPVGQVAFHLLNDLSDNEPHTRVATLEWALRQVRKVAIKDFGNMFASRDAVESMIDIIDKALHTK